MMSLRGPYDNIEYIFLKNIRLYVNIVVLCVRFYCSYVFYIIIVM